MGLMADPEPTLPPLDPDPGEFPPGPSPMPEPDEPGLDVFTLAGPEPSRAGGPAQKSG